MDNKINILIIEESKQVSDRYKTILECLDYDFDINYCNNISCIDELIVDNISIDIIILNMSFLSDKSFYSFIKEVICNDPEYKTVQKIFISGITNTNTVLSNIDIKFYDCIIRPVYASALKRSVNRAIQTKFLLDENKKLIDQIETMKKSLEYFLNCDIKSSENIDPDLIQSLISELAENNDIMSKRYKRINDNLQKALGEIKSNTSENNEND